MFSKHSCFGALIVLAAVSTLPLKSADALQARSFDASGPVAVLPDQTASACATNLGSNTVKVLVAFLNAKTAPNPNNMSSNSILAVREAALDPGHGVCLVAAGGGLFNAAKPTPNSQIPWDNNVLAVVVQGGIFTGTFGPSDNPYVTQPGVILQQGGTLANFIGIVPSLQIKSGGNTFLTPSMIRSTFNPGPPN